MSEAAWDAVFQQEGGDASTLAEGIRTKIIAAAQATEEGDTLLIPSRGAHASAGKQWRIVVELAGARDLTQLEVQHFVIWLEDRWGTEVANGFALPLRTVTLAPPSVRAPIVAPPAGGRPACAGAGRRSGEAVWRAVPARRRGRDCRWKDNVP